MKQTIEINNLQDLIVEKIQNQLNERSYVIKASDREYTINDTLNKIANFLIKVTEVM